MSTAADLKSSLKKFIEKNADMEAVGSSDLIMRGTKSWQQLAGQNASSAKRKQHATRSNHA